MIENRPKIIPPITSLNRIIYRSYIIIHTHTHTQVGKQLTEENF